ncbi:MAG: P-type conjugative transfer protein TrbJ [Rhizobiales bacterium]|nr:P-type conjugative transfer protein TrbJ [Hyphomicrobiales bacterium]
MPNSLLVARHLPRTGGRKPAMCVALLLAIAAVAPQKTLAQQVVFDPWNYTENILSAARALNQINNQIKSLENEARMLSDSARNLTSLPTSVAERLKSHVDEINQLLAQSRGITFELERTNSEFERLYPREYSATASAERMTQDAQARWTNTHEALRQTLQTQSKIVEAIERDGGTLQTLLSASSGAVGALQARQSGNELAGLQVKQSIQLQALIAAQARSDTLRDAERKTSEEMARERFTRFIGDGRAYAGH